MNKYCTSNGLMLLHGKELENFRANVKSRKRFEPKRDSEWAKRFLSLPLQNKIQIALTRIAEWVLYYEGKVYVSFSGGKDSTVLLDLCRRVYPEIPAVFCNTGMEYPEIVEHVKQQHNVANIYPEKSYKRVIEEYGYPVISKNVSQRIREARAGQKASLKLVEGTYKDKHGNKSCFCVDKWKFLMNAPFKISEQCCSVLKKRPFKKYEKTTGRKPIIGTTATESQQRKISWLKNGCNSFNEASQKCQPLLPWTEQNILEYIYMFDLKLPVVYGKVLKDESGKYYTTGVERTGCMGCMFGIHLEKEPNRFQQMAVTHPKHYNAYINKLGQGEVLKYIGVNYKPLDVKVKE